MLIVTVNLFFNLFNILIFPQVLFDQFNSHYSPKKFFNRLVHYNGNMNQNTIALIGGSETVAGFLLTGIGEKKNNEKNFFICDKGTLLLPSYFRHQNR